ncbi:MAG: ABC-type transporter Mla subunit MlaD [Phycisphaerales bacterium]|jgi:ABC-type transporter Mla subunit MlaD
MSQRSSKNNLAAGLFLLSSLVIALAISFWLGGIGDRLGTKAEYVVRFPMSVGVGGLQPGSKVTLAGLEVGRVGQVARRIEGDRVVAMEATIMIDPSIALYSDAAAYLVQPMLGGVSAINVSSVGLTGGPMVEGATIPGGFAPGLLAQIGLGADQADQVLAILSSVESATNEANTLIARLDEVAAAFATDADGSSGDLRGVLADARALSSKFTGENGWQARIDSILSSGDQTAARLPEITDSIQRAADNADSMLAENRPRFGRMMTDAEALMSRVRFDTAVRFEELLDEGVLAAASYREIGDRFNVMLTREYPQIRRTLANVRETSDQAKMAVGELRTQPWRLLDAPSGAELAKEPLYAAARAYAVAVADLRAASEALENAVGSAEARAQASEGSTLASDRGVPGAAELAEIAGEVDAAFARYQDAERALLEKMTAD